MRKGVRVPDKPGKGVADPMRDERRVPEHRLITRLGLADFDVPAPMTEITSVKEVKLMLRQNIGAPLCSLCKVGDTVSVGQKIAAPPEGALGTCLHASIAGTVTAVTDNFVSIKA